MVGITDSLLTIYQMGIQETVDLIFIGFCKPQFYKRSVWNKAVRILEFLCDNTDGAVFRHDRQWQTEVRQYRTENNRTGYKVGVPV